MAVQEQENQTEAQTDEQSATRESKVALSEESSNELQLPVWSVISFEKLEAGGLTYAQAEEKIRELDAQNVPGLCIVTDEVAARIS